ncbi:hypothetical protein [Aureliella helgolandensis]|uniref:Uncharacterized protein n=1 Tax=Aureliella helgolandensis TaxID=2527968 RepID=A0A518G7U3_9BACT|nr:hypothetical protein [Aureliella helgolandensis]QDV24657.1 hypothetical protein Q31a_29770 [Aureliella helgolandensis]
MKRLLWIAIVVAAGFGTTHLAVQLGAQPPSNQPRGANRVGKPSISDTVRANVYADNWFTLYINGEHVAVDSIKFMPHNVVSVDILPAYPMTIAVMAKDNADSETGMEYANTNIGDAGFILKFGDGTVTNASWKAKAFSHGPIDRDTQHPKVRNLPIPENWYKTDFDDKSWGFAKEYSQQQVGPKEPFFEHDFSGASFIWTDDIELDNTVIFRHFVAGSPDGVSRPDFSNLNNIVPDSPPKRPKR